MTSLDTNIRVCIRVRGGGEASGGPLTLDDNTITVKGHGSTGDRTNKFSFDRVFGAEATQEEIYADVGSNAVGRVMEGYNGTIFAYGQTGSGKTHTMLGPNGGHPSCLEEGPDPTKGPYANRGLIPRIGLNLFDSIQQANGQCTVEASFYEIYQEKVRDLLEQVGTGLRSQGPGTSMGRSTGKSGSEGRGLAVMGDRSNVRIVGLSVHSVKAAQDLLGLLRTGAKQRTKRATDSNEYSSRSHAVLVLNLKQQLRDGRELTSKLNLVDLAGSERLSKTGATGKAAQEGAGINLSLSALGQVIHQLCHSHEHISFRNSVLTRVLQDSLGGNAVTTLITALSPSVENLSETVSSLLFANYAKQIKNHAGQNVVLSAGELRVRLENAMEEIAKLRREVAEKNRREQDANAMAKSMAVGGDGGGAASMGTSAKFNTSREMILLAEMGERDRREEELRKRLYEEEEIVAERGIELARCKEELTHWKAMAAQFQASADMWKGKYERERATVVQLQATNDDLLLQVENAKVAQAESEARAHDQEVGFQARMGDMQSRLTVSSGKDTTISALQEQVARLEGERVEQQKERERSLAACQTELAQARQQIAALQRAGAQSKEEVTGMNAALTGAQAREEALTQTTKELRSERDDLSVQIASLRKENHRAVDDVEVLQIKLTQANSEVMVAKAHSREQEDLLREAREEGNRLREAAGRAEASEAMAQALRGRDTDHEAAVGELTGQIGVLKGELGAKREELAEQVMQTAEAQGQLQGLQQRLDEAERQASAANQRAEILDQHNDRLEKEFIAAKTRADDAEIERENQEGAFERQVEEAVAQRDRAIEELEREREAHAEELKGARSANLAKTDQQKDLSDQLVRLQGEVVELRGLLEEAEGRLSGCHADRDGLNMVLKERLRQLQETENVLEEVSAEKDVLGKRAEGYRTALLEKDREIENLKATLTELMNSVEASALSADEKIRILRAAKARLSDELQGLEALAKKLYDEAGQHDFVALATADLELRREELTQLKQSQLMVIAACGDAEGEVMDDGLRALVLDKHTGWSEMVEHLRRVHELLSRTQFINPNDEANRVTLCTSTDAMVVYAQHEQHFFTVGTRTTPEGLPYEASPREHAGMRSSVEGLCVGGHEAYGPQFGGPDLELSATNPSIWSNYSHSAFGPSGASAGAPDALHPHRPQEDVGGMQGVSDIMAELGEDELADQVRDLLIASPPAAH